MAFQTLVHHIDVEWLREAYRRTRKDGAVGVDRQTAEAYASNLEENLQSLLNLQKRTPIRAEADANGLSEPISGLGAAYCRALRGRS